MNHQHVALVTSVYWVVGLITIYLLYPTLRNMVTAFKTLKRVPSHPEARAKMRTLYIGSPYAASVLYLVTFIYPFQYLVVTNMLDMLGQI